MAAGDFDADGFPDIAAAAPGEDGDRGRVTVLRGARRGLAAAGGYELRQGRPPVGGRRLPDDYFGWALAALDSDGDGVSDLAIGALGDRSVTMLRGGSGSTLRASRTLTLGSMRLRMPVEPPDAASPFGALLAPAGF